MTGAPVALRAAPSVKAGIVERIPASATIELSRCARGWCRASWRNHSGYVPADAAALGALPASMTANEMPPPAVDAKPSNASPAFRPWTGPYLGTNFGFGHGAW